MLISVTQGKGEGETELSAFDRALYDAGIANHNLITLSSVIPSGRTVRIEKLTMSENENAGTFGHRLYVVMARYAQSVPGKEAWAGLGWVQGEDGRGLFVEHEGESREYVEKLTRDSLGDMVKYRKDSFGEIQMSLCGAKCENKPVCAMVAAVYKSEGWE